MNDFSIGPTTDPLYMLSMILLSDPLWSDSESQGKIAECCSKVTSCATERGAPYFQALEALAKAIAAVEEGGDLVCCSDLGLEPAVQKDLILVKNLLWARESDAADVEHYLQEARKRQFPKTLLARCGDSEIDVDVEMKKYEAALNEDCTICLQRNREDDIHTTACGHIFHQSCIERWNQEKKACPICKDTMNMERQKTIWQQTAAKIEEKRGKKRPREEAEIIDVDTCSDYEYAKMVENAMKREDAEKARQLHEDEELARKLFYEDA